MELTNQELGLWIFKLFGAMFCCIFVYSYIKYRISLLREKKVKKEKAMEPAALATHGPNPVTQSGDEILDLLIKQGYCLALDVGVLSKYPQLLQVEPPDRVMITEEIARTKIRGKVVGIHQFSMSEEMPKPFKTIHVNESFAKRIGLDTSNITDRAISAYLYEEKTNLIHVIFLTLDPDAQKRAEQVGLQSMLV